MTTARYTDEQWKRARVLLEEHLSKTHPDGRKSILPWQSAGVYTVFCGGKAAGRFEMADLVKGLVKAK